MLLASFCVETEDNFFLVELLTQKRLMSPKKYAVVLVLQRSSLKETKPAQHKLPQICVRVAIRHSDSHIEPTLSSAIEYGD